MKNITRLVILMVIILNLLFLSSCGMLEGNLAIIGSEVTQQQIFLHTIIGSRVMNEPGLIQVWRIDWRGDEYELLLEHPKISNKPITELFSLKELAAFEEWNNLVGGNFSASELYPSVGSKVIPSPNRCCLALQEGIFWDQPNGPVSFGMHKIKVLNLESRAQKLLYEVTMHPEGWLNTGNLDGVVQITWSPDSQKIAFVEGFLNGAYQPRIVNIETGEIESLGEPGEGGLFPTWSPDGSQIVMAVAEEPGGKLSLNIVSATNSFSPKRITNFWSFVKGIDWSPDGKYIVFAASKESSEERLRVYLLNVETEDIVELPLDKSLSYAGPQWSSDGKYIGLNVSPSSHESTNELAIYEVASKQIVTKLEGERFVDDWYWTKDGEAILVNRGGGDEPNRVELYYWKESRTEAVSLPEGVEYGVAIGIE